VTVERGIDPRELALVAFGGAGPLHATAIAGELGMTRVVVPRSSGVLSALGLVVSDPRRDLVESVLLTGKSLTRDAIATVVRKLAGRGREELSAPHAETRATYDLRYSGQAFELAVPGGLEPDPDALRRAFDDAHAERYGYGDPDAELELVTIRVAVAIPGAEPAAPARQAEPTRTARDATFDGRRLRTAVIGGAPAAVEGPAICELPEATLVVPPGWAGEPDADGTIVLERRS
jgi:N-methylhydantoinase A